MGKLLKYIRIIGKTLRGYLMSLSYLVLPARSVKLTDREDKITVSVTSYGRRVGKTLRYTILSLLHQTVMPDRIVVWLSQDEFNSDTIPGYLKRYIMKYNIDVRFCPDLKSYKKLVPSLGCFNDGAIVTVDDDIVYDRHLIEHLYHKHQQEPGCVVCSNAHRPRFDENGFLPYREWNLNSYFTNDTLIFPLGASGILYPKDSLHPDVMDSSLFFKLAPNADDVWFWVMALRNGTSARVTGHSNLYMEIDLVHQYFHKQSSLKSQNLFASHNDTQLDAVIRYFGIVPSREYLYNLLHKGKN